MAPINQYKLHNIFHSFNWLFIFESVDLSEEKTRIVTGSDGKAWTYSAKMDVLDEKVRVLLYIHVLYLKGLLVAYLTIRR